jgi:hypothetical protein
MILVDYPLMGTTRWKQEWVLPSVTEHPLPQSIALPDHISVPTDSSLHAPVTPTPPQTISQPQTTESIRTELTEDNPDQDAPWTHGLKHHSMTTTDPSPESSSQEPPIPPTDLPTNWGQLSKRAKKHWFQHHKTNTK